MEIEHTDGNRSALCDILFGLFVTVRTICLVCVHLFHDINLLAELLRKD